MDDAVRLTEADGTTRLAFGNGRVLVENADLRTLAADALVCPVDPTLDTRDGLAKILLEAGRIPQKDARSVVQEPFGKVIVLPAGELRAKYIFMTVLLGERGLDKMRLSIRQAVDRSIQYAEFLKLRSLAFPLMGSALDLPPYEFVAKEMLEQVASYMRRRRTRLKLVLFSILNPTAYQAFRKEARSIAAL